MRRYAINLAVLAAVVGLPILGQRLADGAGLSDYSQGILYKIALNITLAVGLSLIIGFAGQFSIGHAAFMSLGAFFSGMFTSHVLANWIAGMDSAYLESNALSAVLLRSGFLLTTMLVAMGVAAVASVLVGLPSLRLRGDYLAIATLGFGEIVYNLLLIYLQKQHADTAYYMPYSLGFMSQTVNVASAWMLALLSILVVRNLISSTSGRALPAIREDEIGAAAVGIRTTRYKLLAFVIGSSLAAAAGALESHQTLTINPASYRFDRSIEIIVPVVLGGSGSLTGCVIAAAAFTYLLEALRDLPSNAQQYRTIAYAAVLVLVMILRPQGIMGRFEISDVWRWLHRGKRAARDQRSASMAAADPSPLPPAGPAATLECRDLVMRFGGILAVQRFNLTLRPGEIVGLIGPNGAGKTTCFNMITGVYRPTSGTIAFGAHSLVGLGPAAVNRLGIARTFQNIRLFSNLSVLDNVRVALHAHLKTGAPAAILRTAGFYEEECEARTRALQYLDFFGLSEKAEYRANGLPYGDQRRLEIARALATLPRALCLDEPAAGMNPVEKRELMGLIRRIRERFGVSILLIEHDMHVVMGVCERIVVLDHGECIAEGAPEQIRCDPRVIEAYLGKPVPAGSA